MSAIVGIHRTVTARQTAADASDAGKADVATVSIGMAVALGALTMTFAALLLAYAIVRVQAATWPPPGEAPVPRSWVWLLSATFAALAGSAAIHVARRNMGRAAATVVVGVGVGVGIGMRGRVQRALVAAAGAGTTFIAIQVCGWRWLLSSGIRPSSGMVASVVYALTLFHALHALAALVVLLPILLRAVRGGAVGASALAALSSFWHLVTVLWIVVCLAVFVA